MSTYLKILPAVLLDPEALFFLGQKINMIVRESLILDTRLEDICSAIEREGRTLCEVISRSAQQTSDIDKAVIACEKSCLLLKTSIQLNMFSEDQERQSAASTLINTMESPEKHLEKKGYDISIDRIRDIVINLSSDSMIQILNSLRLLHFYDELKEHYRHLEIIQIENESNDKTELLPTLRSTISLYGMLIDTLIANIRFENYRLLHRVEPILLRIEAIAAEAVKSTIKQNEKLSFYLKEEKCDIDILH